MNDKPPATPTADPALQALRAEIDALDDAMHDLLMRRAGVVARMAASRVKAGAGSPLRPGREAAVLRRLLARHSGALSRGAVVRIWRHIIMAHTAIQGAFTAAVSAASEAAQTLALAREHFGTATPLTPFAAPAQALAALSVGKASVAVLAAPTGEGEGAWWQSLEAPRLSVVARLPFVANAAHADAAMVVAPLAADASGEDRSLLRLEGSADATCEGFARMLTEARFAGRILSLVRQGGRSLALAEIDAFIAAGDPRIAGLQAVLLGAYAVPVAGDLP
ncbi:MAG: chorismate mutase [Alphaproteobacteria bacterium]|nr:chorismate mutase [Alphaproteobacteria bacterium]